METFLLILSVVFWFFIAPFLAMPLTILLFAIVPILLLAIVYFLAKFVFKNDPMSNDIVRWLNTKVSKKPFKFIFQAGLTMFLFYGIFLSFQFFWIFFLEIPFK
ncbi:hypothetical protein OAL90_01565 [Hyphomicrobiales bacterium]|nr:hypothetical protein [Hyphomicrobiales bacterium]